MGFPSESVGALVAERTAPTLESRHRVAGYYPDMVEHGNIDLTNRPDVTNADGSHSSVRSMSFSEGGPEILVPTVAHDGSRILSDDEAVEQYYKTKLHLGKFKTPEAATHYAGALHRQQEAAPKGSQTQSAINAIANAARMGR